MRGKKAMSTTRAEFVTVLQRFKACADAVLRPGSFPELPVGAHLWWQWDNVSFHNPKPITAQLRAMGIYDHHILYHPPLSPDFNRVVENAHSRLMAGFRDVLSDHPDVTTPEGYVDLFERMVNGSCPVPGGFPCISVASTRKNFEGLPMLWMNVEARHGHYSTRRFMQ
jgi:hypothetical protein